MNISQSSLKKPSRMMPCVVENNAVEFFLLRIGHKLLDRRTHVMRIAHQENTRTLEGLKIGWQISCCGIGFYKQNIRLLRDFIFGKKLYGIVAARRRLNRS